MNEMSQWRQSIARHFASLYALNPHVAAVIVGGSSVRGHSDEQHLPAIDVDRLRRIFRYHRSIWEQPPGS